MRLENKAKQPKIKQQLLAASQRIDALLISLWATFPALASCALVAVGGYGREEMYLHSDVDLLLLQASPTDSPPDKEPENTAISAFITQAWDLGLHLGHSVRTINDCLYEASQDITVQTALLEARLITGDAPLFKQLQAQFLLGLNPAQFLQAKQLEMQQRHQRHENTPYNLEPNCKESPGGLRDLHVLLWIAKAAQLGNNWKALQMQGILSATETSSLHRAEHFIQTIRQTLHTLAKRREDRLVFDWQAALAQSLGYSAKPGRRASEVLMQRYYVAAKTILQLNSLLLQALERRILGESSYQQLPLNSNQPNQPNQPNQQFCEQNGFLHALDANLFQRQPLAILQAFHVLAEHPHLRDLSADTQRWLWNARDRIVHIRHTEAFNRSFLHFFERGTGLTRSFRRMNDLSILGRCLPSFRHIVGQMQHDLFHVYTVDQHILTVLRNMRRFVMPQHVHEYPLCSQLIAHFEPKAVLYIAALFHDIAKGRGGDHSDLGQQDVRRFGRKMRLPTPHIELATFLVKHHLTMSTVAQKSDLSHPEVIAKFAAIVGNESYLTALYLLTVADIRGTSPKVWTAWKAKLLEQLYHQTIKYLHQKTNINDIKYLNDDNPPAHAAQTAVRQWLPSDLDPTPLWDSLEDAYFLRNEPQDAAWHTQTLLSQINAPLTVSSRVAPDGTSLQVMVYTQDQAELFGRLCSCFDVLGLGVLDAQVYTTRTGYALDHFVLTLPEHPAPQALQLLIHTLETNLKHSLSQRPALPAPRSSRLPRQARHFAFAPQIHLAPDEKSSAYLLEIQAVDQASLLYRIAQVFTKHHITVHTARITTLGGRAEDFFLIGGSILEHAKTQLQLETALLAAVQV